MKSLRIAGMTPVLICFCLALGVADATIDQSTPLEELKTLAAGGNGDAMLEYGERLIEGRGADKNVDEGLNWFHKAAETGKSQAWYDIGFVYSNGLKSAPDMTEAMKNFRKGAELGNADCQTSMGLFYQAGEKIPGGVKADPVEAVKWYTLAAEQNHTEAIQHLAMMSAMGMGVTQDYAVAERWFRKGAELGNADCIWGLGQCYLDGKGVKQDTLQAYVLFSASLDGVENAEQKQAMTERRDKLGITLSAEQLKKAEPLIAEWKKKSAK